MLLFLGLLAWARRKVRRGTLRTVMVTKTPLLIESDREVEVVGESYYQPALERAAGGRNEWSAREPVDAMLVPEFHNPTDKNAIAVYVDGAVVGHLSRRIAPSYRPVVERAWGMGFVLTCGAVVVGGWDRGGDDRGSFGIVLYLATPATVRREIDRALVAGAGPGTAVGPVEESSPLSALSDGGHQ